MGRSAKSKLSRRRFSFQDFRNQPAFSEGSFPQTEKPSLLCSTFFPNARTAFFPSRKTEFKIDSRGIRAVGQGAFKFVVNVDLFFKQTFHLLICPLVKILSSWSLHNGWPFSPLRFLMHRLFFKVIRFYFPCNRFVLLCSVILVLTPSFSCKGLKCT